MVDLTAKKYPTLTKYLGERATKILISAYSKPEENNEDPSISTSSELLKAGGSGYWDIDEENIRKMVIGSRIYTTDSIFQVSPIFDISLLDKYQKLDKNLQSSATPESSMGLFSNQKASTDASMFGLKIGVEAKTSFWGAGQKASLGFSMKKSQQNSTSSGETTLSMIYAIRGAYVDMLVQQGTQADNLSAYLIGERLNEDELNSYVNKEEGIVTISVEQIDSFDKGNVLGYVQLIGEMEDVFGGIKREYKNTTDDVKKIQLIQQMIDLKEKISHSIQVFYSNYGDYFASRILLAAYAVGGGTLKFENNSGNSENQ